MRAFASGLGLTLLAAVVLVPGCAWLYNPPFLVTPGELRRRGHTIASFPTQASSHLADEEVRRAVVEPVVTGRLVAGGFKVIGSEQVARIRDDAAKTVGDLFDRTTGERNEANWKLVKAAVQHALAVKSGVDGILYTGITSVGL